MAWHLYEINDDAREVFVGLTRKNDWYTALGALGVGKAGDADCNLQDSWPLWIDATRNLPEPLSLLFKGELRIEGGPDPDVGFLSAKAVREISQMLTSSDEYFLGLINATEFAKQNPGIGAREMSVLGFLRPFFAGAALRGKAVVVLRA